MDADSSALDLPVLDVSTGLRRMKNDASFYDRLLRQFMGRLAQIRDQIVAAVEAGDQTGLRFAAHNLKGGALTLGLQRLGEASEGLESAVGDTQAASARLGDVLDEIAAAEEAIAARLGG